MQFLEENKKQKQILKFGPRSKSSNPSKSILNKQENSDMKMGLSQLVRANFEKNKIKNLENPNTQEIALENRYVRDKTPFTQELNNLKETICKFCENFGNFFNLQKFF